MEEKITTLEIGKPFFGPVPSQEGAVMELWDIGLVVLIQIFGVDEEKIDAFRAGFSQYSYLESNTPVPVACWVFDFPDPHGPIDCVFDAKIVKSALMTDYLDTREGVKNAVYFFLVDGKILKAAKVVGLDQEAIKLFHNTIRKQLITEYEKKDIKRYLKGLFSYSTRELSSMGRTFVHK